MVKPSSSMRMNPWAPPTSASWPRRSSSAGAPAGRERRRCRAPPHPEPRRLLPCFPSICVDTFPTCALLAAFLLGLAAPNVASGDEFLRKRLVEQGLNSLKERNYHEAISCFERVLSATPDFTPALDRKSTR